MCACIVFRRVFTTPVTEGISKGARWTGRHFGRSSLEPYRLFVSGQPPHLQTPGLLRLREPGPCAYTYQSFSPLDKASILFGNCTAIDIWKIARTSTVCRWPDTTIYPVVVGGTVLQCMPLCLVLIS
jgi:hypothetical protein